MQKKLLVVTVKLAHMQAFNCLLTGSQTMLNTTDSQPTHWGGTMYRL